MSGETIASAIARWLMHLPARLTRWLLLLWHAIVNFGRDRVPQMAAAISYFALLSTFPFLLLALAIFGLVLRDEGLQQRVLTEIVAALPIEAPTIEEALRNLAGSGTSMGVFALVGTVIAASALARSLRGSLNVIFKTGHQRPLLVGWLLDLTVLPVLGLLFITSLLLSTVWRFAQAIADDLGFEEVAPLWELGALAIPALLSFVGLLLIYLLLPNRTLHVLDLWPGALIAMVGFQVGTFAFSIYFENFGAYDIVYGSLGGVIALLAWVYVSSMILLFGAEVAAEASRRRGGQGAEG